jgi:phage tail P2-like protein
MKSPFPYPAINYLPKEFQAAPEAASLAAALDRVASQVSSDILGMRDRYSAESCPASVLDELAASIGVDIYHTDTDKLKRAKIANGVRSQQFKGLWLQDIFNRIKNITGIDPVLITWTQSATWIFTGDNSGPAMYAIFGTDGVDTLTGFDLEGTGTELGAGSIWIDIGVGQLANVPRVVADLRNDACPAYFLITLGYTSGSFIAYAGGQF